ncbi:MAG: enhanced entry protein EnhB [Legionella sp.]|nr:MAG: enhanced entry protein EnhB [Legionella sp.]
MSIFKPYNILFVLSALFFNAAIAAPAATSPFPRGCEVTGFGYNQNYLILNESGDQTYFLIQNRSTDKIELERQDTGDAFMTPPLQTTLEPSNWAAFASDVKNLNFKCFKHQNENTAVVDCREVLEVCQYPRVKFALSNMGNYWISTNKSQNEVIQDSVAKGIYLKW